VLFTEIKEAKEIGLMVKKRSERGGKKATKSREKIIALLSEDGKQSLLWGL
jgi:hypothetical protein